MVKILSLSLSLSLNSCELHCFHVLCFTLNSSDEMTDEKSSNQMAIKIPNKFQNVDTQVSLGS